jgi:hypothetical protein
VSRHDRTVHLERIIQLASTGSAKAASPLLFCGLGEYQSSRMTLSQIYPVLRLICGHFEVHIKRVHITGGNQGQGETW